MGPFINPCSFWSERGFFIFGKEFGTCVIVNQRHGKKFLCAIIPDVPAAFYFVQVALFAAHSATIAI